MLFIHIGFHKTGTSTIQYFAQSNQAKLAECGLIYPDLGRIKGGHGHTNLAGELRGSQLFRPHFGGLDHIMRQMTENPDKHFILSSEALHVLPLEQIRDLLTRLPPIEVRIIAYVRDLAALTVSAYAQNAKTGHFVEDFDEFFATRVMNQAASKSGYRGFTELKAWAEVFGWEAMHVRELDERHLDGGDLLTDFLHAVGIDWSDLGPDVDRGPRNVSPGWKAVELIRSVQASAGGLRGQREEEGYSAIRRSAKAIHGAGEAIADRQDLNADKGDYLTREQLDVCAGLYLRFVEQLNGVLRGRPLPPRKESALRPRSFLPKPERIPLPERAAFYTEMSFELARTLRSFTAPPSHDDPPEIAADKAAIREERRTVRHQKRQAEKAAKRLERGERRGRPDSHDSDTPETSVTAAEGIR